MPAGLKQRTPIRRAQPALRGRIKADRQMKRAVVFDLDDTLYRESDYVRSGFGAVGAHLGRGDELARWLWALFQTGERSKLFDAMGRRFGLGLDAAGIAELVDVYRRHRPGIHCCRGVKPLLHALRRRGLRLGLLSDGYLPAQRLKLSAVGLEGFFDAVVFTEDIGPRAWKPSPEGYQLIRRRLGLAHQGCVYVGDNPAKDFLAPNGLGWLTVQWRRRGQIHADNPPPPGGAPQRVVRSGPELLRTVTAARRRIK